MYLRSTPLIRPLTKNFQNLIYLQVLCIMSIHPIRAVSILKALRIMAPIKKPIKVVWDISLINYKTIEFFIFFSIFK